MKWNKAKEILPETFQGEAYDFESRQVLCKCEGDYFTVARLIRYEDVDNGFWWKENGRDAYEIEVLEWAEIETE